MLRIQNVYFESENDWIIQFLFWISSEVYLYLIFFLKTDNSIFSDREIYYLHLGAATI